MVIWDPKQVIVGRIRGMAVGEGWPDIGGILFILRIDKGSWSVWRCILTYFLITLLAIVLQYMY